MSPDPSHQSEERRCSTEETHGTAPVIHSENDNNDISYEGYQVLPQDFNESNIESEDVDSEDGNSKEESPVNSVMASSTFDQATKLELTELWNSSYNNRVADIKMDSVKEEEIKTAMAGFNLPPSSIPFWAKSIPEEQWKQEILSKINSSNKI